MLADILLLIGITFMYSSPLAFGALGGVMSERSGVINIGIEGMMTIGAFSGSAAAFFTGDPWIGFLMAGFAGMLTALLHAVVSVTFKADQTISGIAINFLGPGVALFLSRLLFGGATTTQMTKTLPVIFGDMIKKDSPLSHFNFNVTVVLALIFTFIVWFVFYKTKWGLRIRSIGEHPAAADTLGISVSKVRYICVLISGLLAGFGGAAMTLAVVPQFAPMVISGQGFIALAAVIFGKWTPFGAYGACLLFGFAEALTVYLSGGKFEVPSEILAMLPYVLTIIVLILFLGKTVAPKANGQPYRKGSR